MVWQQDGITVYEGDCLEILPTLEAGSVNCCVTSPPYWGLRDYGTASWVGGDAECEHREKEIRQRRNLAEAANACDGGSRTSEGRLDKDALWIPYRDICGKCGAKRIDQQLGLESTPEEYVAKMVSVFREVRRVLRDDGTLWLNIGDSYAGSWGNAGGQNRGNGTQRSIAGKSITKDADVDRHGSYVPPGDRGFPESGIKPKDLVGIPWMLAFALRADGWYLRQDIIWCLSGGTWVYARTKKGDMPIMVRDLSRLKLGTVQLWNGEKWTKLLGMSKSSRHGDELEIVLRSGERISCTPTHRFPTNRGLLDAGDLQVGDSLISCKLPEPEIVKDCAIEEDAAWFAGLYLAEGSKSGDTIQIAGHVKEVERWEHVQRIARKYGGTATRTVTGNCMNIRVYGKVINAIIDELVTGKTAKDKGFATVVWRYSNGFVAAMIDGYLSGDGHADGNRWRLGFCRNYNLERDLRTACARLGYALILNLASVEYDGKQVPTFRGELRKERSGHWNEKDRNEIVAIRKSRCREVYDLGVEDEPHLFALASGILTHNSKPNPMPESVTDRCTKAHEYIFLLSKSERYYFDSEAIQEPAIGGTPGNTKPTKGGRAYDNGAGEHRTSSNLHKIGARETRNKRSVWTVNTKPYAGAHFAVFPPELIAPCILAGCPEGGTVLDPFTGSGTTAEVAQKNGCKFVGCELNPEYIELIKKRFAQRNLFAGS